VLNGLKRISYYMRGGKECAEEIHLRLKMFAFFKRKCILSLVKQFWQGCRRL